MRESQIEAYLVERCKAAGIGCEKFVSPQKRNVPDRLLTSRSMAIFVELKATGKKPTEAQARDHRKRIHNATVVWTDSIEGVDVVVECILARRPIPYGPTFKVEVQWP